MTATYEIIPENRTESNNQKTAHSFLLRGPLVIPDGIEEMDEIPTFRITDELVVDRLADRQLVANLIQDTVVYSAQPKTPLADALAIQHADVDVDGVTVIIKPTENTQPDTSLSLQIVPAEKPQRRKPRSANSQLTEKQQRRQKNINAFTGLRNGAYYTYGQRRG